MDQVAAPAITSRRAITEPCVCAPATAIIFRCPSIRPPASSRLIRKCANKCALALKLRFTFIGCQIKNLRKWFRCRATPIRRCQQPSSIDRMEWGPHQAAVANPSNCDLQHCRAKRKKDPDHPKWVPLPTQKPVAAVDEETRLNTIGALDAKAVHYLTSSKISSETLSSQTNVRVVGPMFFPDQAQAEAAQVPDRTTVR